MPYWVPRGLRSQQQVRRRLEGHSVLPEVGFPTEEAAAAGSRAVGERRPGVQQRPPRSPGLPGSPGCPLGWGSRAGAACCRLPLLFCSFLPAPPLSWPPSASSSLPWPCPTSISFCTAPSAQVTEGVPGSGGEGRGGQTPRSFPGLSRCTHGVVFALLTRDAWTSHLVAAPLRWLLLCVCHGWRHRVLVLVPALASAMAPVSDCHSWGWCSRKAGPAAGLRHRARVLGSHLSWVPVSPVPAMEVAPSGHRSPGHHGLWVGRSLPGLSRPCPLMTPVWWARGLDRELSEWPQR